MWPWVEMETDPSKFDTAPPGSKGLWVECRPRIETALVS